MGKIVTIGKRRKKKKDDSNQTIAITPEIVASYDVEHFRKKYAKIIDQLEPYCTEDEWMAIRIVFKINGARPDTVYTRDWATRVFRTIVEQDIIAKMGIAAMTSTPEFSFEQLLPFFVSKAPIIDKVEHTGKDGQPMELVMVLEDRLRAAKERSKRAAITDGGTDGEKSSPRE